MSRLDHLLSDTVTYATWSSVNNYGDPTWGSQSTAAARVEYTTTRIIDSSGEERDAQAKVYTETDISDKARIWLPGDNTNDANSGRLVMRRKESSTPNGGTTLYVLYL